MCDAGVKRMSVLAIVVCVLADGGENPTTRASFYALFTGKTTMTKAKERAGEEGWKSVW